MRNIDELIGRIKETVDSHFLGQEGQYCRWLWEDPTGEKERKLGLNEYGCADAANILYTIHEFPSDPEKRKEWVEVLQSMQNPQTGLFEEGTHHPIHTTAHCAAALELFDAKPLHPLTALKEQMTPDGIRAFLEELEWADVPWKASHKGAGIYAAMVLTDSVNLEWERAYFDWLYENQDPKTGMWRVGCVDEGTASPHAYVGGSFHYLFNIEYAKRPIKYAKEMVDRCLYLYENNMMGDKIGTHDNDLFGRYVSFLEMDWIYTISRASRRANYRQEECKQVIRDFAKGYIDWLYSVDHRTHDSFNDLHKLFGTCCSLAELQQYLVGEFETTKPLRLVLDRRPFI